MMGICIHCDQPAGLLKKKHRECDQKFNVGREHIATLIERLAGKSSEIEADIDRIAEVSFISGPAKKEALAAGYERAVSNALEDDLLSAEEEDKLADIQSWLGKTEQWR